MFYSKLFNLLFKITAFDIRGKFLCLVFAWVSSGVGWTLEQGRLGRGLGKQLVCILMACIFGVFLRRMACISTFF